MKSKYNAMSIVGKIWTIAELYNAGTRDKKESYINAAIRKLEELEESNEYLNSTATHENSIYNILNHITGETSEFVNDNSLVSVLWYNRAWLDDIKKRIKNNEIENYDLSILEDIYREIKRFYVKDLKEKKFSSQEKQDLFNIKDEIKNLKIKIKTRVNRNQINVL